MFLVLGSITIIAGLSLGSVFEATKEPIALAKSLKKELAIKNVVPAFDNMPGQDSLSVKVTDGSKLMIYPAKKAGVLVGAAVESTSSKGFGGEVKIMIGFDTNGQIVDYSVLEHKETPGLGTKMDPWFRTGKGDIRKKVPGKNKMTVSKDGGEIDAITAATISSRAFLDAVNKGHEGFEKAMKKLNMEEAN